MASGHPPRAGPARPARHTAVPTEWRIELPDNGAVRSDSEFGGCRSIEAGYNRGPVLGQGTYGEVYLATDLATGDQVAAKKIKMDNEKEGFPITAIREIKILSALANAQEELNQDPDTGASSLLRNNIIGLREIVRSGSHKVNNFKGSIYMMFDYMDHDMTGLLERSQKEGKRFTAAQIKCYLKQLFSGLWLLDKRDILHRDLKNANLLVNNKGELKIADFGLARYYTPDRSEAEPRQMTNRVITLWYRPPELFLGAERYGTEVDTWSAGCIMFELLTGKPLFPGKDEVDQLEKIFSIMGQPTEQSMPGCTSYPNYQTACGGGVAQRFPPVSKLRQHCSQRGVTDPQALNLLEALLALNPAARIKAQAAVTHEYFFTNPMPAALCDMPKFPSSHEMTMKRARHEQRYGGGQQRGQQQQQQQQRGQQQGQQGAAHYQQQQGGPAAQRQRTQGQYSGPQAPYIQPQPGQHRSGGAGQQPYRGGGGGIAPAAGAGMGGGAGMRMPVGGVAPAGIMPGTVLTQQQVQQMMAHGTGIVGMGMGMGLGMQAGAMQQSGASAGYAYAGQAPRPAAYGAPAGGGSHTGLQPHRAGGGALPMWQKERR